MTAATAYDLCSSALARATPGTREHLRIERTLAEWAEHPALKATIAPNGGSFEMRRSSDGRVLADTKTLREAAPAALDHGFRVIDITACGCFFQVQP